MSLPVDEFDIISRPRHYNVHPSGVECIEIKEWMVPCLSDALKYLWRREHKADLLEDVRKAQWYVRREIDRREHWGILAEPRPFPDFVWTRINQWMRFEPAGPYKSVMVLILNGSLPSLVEADKRLDKIIENIESEQQ